MHIKILLMLCFRTRAEINDLIGKEIQRMKLCTPDAKEIIFPSVKTPVTQNKWEIQRKMTDSDSMQETNAISRRSLKKNIPSSIRKMARKVKAPKNQGSQKNVVPAGPSHSILINSINLENPVDGDPDIPRNSALR
jgi:hypothetical protein